MVIEVKHLVSYGKWLICMSVSSFYMVFIDDDKCSVVFSS
jgi:hypothetical protein